MNNRSLFSLVILITAFLIGLPGCSTRKKLTKREREKIRLAQVRPHKNKKIDRLTFDEAKQVYEYYKKHGETKQRTAIIARMVTLSTDHDVIEPLLHELADLTFETQNYAKAEEFYAQYAAMYPGSSSIDFVKSQHIEAAYQQISLPQRDQSKTKEIIALADNFINSFSPKNPFMQRVLAIRQTCYFNLMESEVNQILFYLHRYDVFNNPKSLESAWQRLMYMNRSVLPYVTNAKVQAVHQAMSAQETTAETTDRSTPDRASIEGFLMPLRMMIRKHAQEQLPAHKHPWRNRF